MDVWQLGVMLHELLHLEGPFWPADMTDKEVLRRLVTPGSLPHEQPRATPPSPPPALQRSSSRPAGAYQLVLGSLALEDSARGGAAPGGAIAHKTPQMISQLISQMLCRDPAGRPVMAELEKHLTHWMSYGSVISAEEGFSKRS